MFKTLLREDFFQFVHGLSSGSFDSGRVLILHFESSHQFRLLSFEGCKKALLQLILNLLHFLQVHHLSLQHELALVELRYQFSEDFYILNQRISVVLGLDVLAGSVIAILNYFQQHFDQQIDLKSLALLF